MGFRLYPDLLTCSVKRLLGTAVIVPILSLFVLSPCYSAPANQGGSVFSSGLFHFGKKKPVESQNAQMSAQSDSRVTDLQQQVRELTGKIEELNFMVLQMQEQLRQLQENSGAPTGQQSPESQKKAQSIATQSRSTIADTSSGQDMSRAAAEGTPASGVTADKSGEQKNINDKEAPKDLGSIEFDKNGNILNGSINQNAIQNSPQNGANVQTEGSLPAVPQTTSAKELYDLGYKNILSGDYRTAEADFRAFQERYPTDQQIADASFWLGESLFGQKRYREAAQAYIEVQKNYKDSPRGPENLLKLGMSMAHLDEQKVACATFAEVTKRYKTVDPAVLKRVKDEQSRNKCQQ